jgi:hypothetical protein
MKKYIPFILLSVLFLSVHSQSGPANTSKKPKKITSASFSGHWRGAEKCASVSTPVDNITIVTSGAFMVLVSGIYSTQGRVKGTIKDGILTIPLQQVNDPNFVNLALEATITLSDDRQSLIVRFSVQNNNLRDECNAVYKK